jgi:hypothetical protein
MPSANDAVRKAPMMHLGGAGTVKARMFRAAVSAAMVAAVVQSLGAGVKW